MERKTIETVENTLREEGIVIYKENDGGSLLFLIGARNGRFVCDVTVTEGPDDKFGDIINFMCHYPEPTLEEKRVDVLETINRLNSNLTVGSLHVDLDGSICCRTSVHIPRDQVTTEIIRNLLAGSMVVLDNSLPTVRDVIQGNALDDEEDFFAGLKGEMHVL